MSLRFNGILIAVLMTVLISVNAVSSPAQTIDWNVDLDVEFDGKIPPNKSIGGSPGELEPLPEPSDTPVAVEARIDFLGLAVHDTDDSHIIYVVYSPDFREIEVVVFERSYFEVYRRRFWTADVQAVGSLQSPTPGQCRVYCYGGDDEVHYLLAIPAWIEGGPGDDQLYGGDDWDHLMGGEGNDRIFGGWGMDSVQGGPGNDYVAGGPGMDAIFGGAGDDVIDANDGVIDFAYGRAGRDTFLVDSYDVLLDFDPAEDIRP